MIQGGFLGKEDRGEPIALARDRSSARRVTHRANAVALLDEGWSCRHAAHPLLRDDGTSSAWRKLFEPRGIEGLASFLGFSLRAKAAANLPRLSTLGRFTPFEIMLSAV